jgi:hypothetical protein
MRAQLTSERTLTIQRLAASFRAGACVPQEISEDVRPHSLSIISTPAGSTVYASPPALVKTLCTGSHVANWPLTHQSEPRLCQSPGS